MKAAIKTDNVHAATDYSALYDKVVNVFSSSRYNLIEYLAIQIASTLTDDYCPSICRVINCKPNTPIHEYIDTVEVGGHSSWLKI